MMVLTDSLDYCCVINSLAVQDTRNVFKDLLRTARLFID